MQKHNEMSVQKVVSKRCVEIVTVLWKFLKDFKKPEYCVLIPQQFFPAQVRLHVSMTGGGLRSGVEIKILNGKNTMYM